MKQVGRALILVGLLLASGCDEEEQYVLRFSHHLHVEENGIECGECHEETEQGLFTLPAHDICVMCHEDIIETDKIAEETCGTCHVEQDLEAIGKLEPPKRPTRDVFRHSEALQGACRECHGTMFVEGVEHIWVWTREDVVAIREKGMATDRPCKACHQELDPKWAPSNHQRNWIDRHGVYAAEHEFDCTSCHFPDNCDECHRARQPSSHNTLWRLRTHGIEASWDRQRCQVCHQEDFCSGCHRDVRPRSHSAAWRQRHCLQCHSSLSLGTGCETCHPGGIEVHEDLAPPAWHADLAISCLNSGCHGPVDGSPNIRLVPSQHPFLDETECQNCHQL